MDKNEIVKQLHLSRVYMDIRGWKGIKIWICKEPGMQLWMSLQSLKRNENYGGSKLRLIEVFPYKLKTDCKCSNCRYTKWRNEKLDL